MKKIGLIVIAATLTMVVLAACEKSETAFFKAIEGTYVGTLTELKGLNSRTALNTSENATADITEIDNKTIKIHMYSVSLDTTFLLNYYEHLDSVEVCFTGDDFENMYGHMLGQGHMSGGMINDMQNDETEWMHHLNDEHLEDDVHFGGFDMQDHSFGYRFDRIEKGMSNKLEFMGTKL